VKKKMVSVLGVEEGIDTKSTLDKYLTIPLSLSYL
jgi:hypothetical protein